MSLQKTIIAAAVVLLVCFLVANPPFANPVLKRACAGPLGDVVKPFFSVSELYDSNLFRVKDKGQLKTLIGSDRLSDFITTYSAGASVNYIFNPGSQSIFLLGREDLFRYAHYSGLNDDQNEIRGVVTLRFLDRLTAAIEGAHAKLMEPREDYQSPQEGTQTKNSGAISLIYDLPSGFQAKAAARRDRVLYSIFPGRDETIKDYSGALAYAPSADGRLEIGYERIQADFDSAQFFNGLLIKSDNAGDAVKATIYKKFSPKTELTISGGYLWRKYDDNIRAFNGLTGSAQLNYKATGKLLLFASAARQLYEEVYLDQFYSVNNSFTAGAEYRITEKIKAFASGVYLDKSFRGEESSSASGRRDNLYLFKAGVGWKPARRFSVDISSQYEIRHSSVDVFGFKDNMVEITVGYKF